MRVVAASYLKQGLSPSPELVMVNGKFYVLQAQAAVETDGGGVRGSGGARRRET